MKVSLNWVKQFTEITLDRDELIDKIGRQLGAVETVTDWGKRYEGVVVAQITAKKDHTSAEKLGVYQIDIGSGETIQVVAGDKSLEVGDKVGWIRPGATVPSTIDHEPLVIEARDLRGETSNGMMGSGAELQFNDNHDGVLQLDTDATPGTALSEAYELNDVIIDIENKMFTHRPDCFGILGVAREIAGIQQRAFTSPDWYQEGLGRIKPGDKALPLTVRNEAGDLVPRFSAITIANVNIKPSPLSIQSYLTRLGVRPINNVVDVTNYIMLLTGQPLHAFDYDKVARLSGELPTLMARKATENEHLSLLNGKTVALHPDTVVIATDKQAIGIGGVMGGTETEVDDQTKNIIVEAANFDMYAIRRTSMRLGLFTEAVTRFNKGQSPDQTERIIEEAVVTLQYLTGGETAGPLFDEYPAPRSIEPVTVTRQFINERLGFDLSTPDIAQLLSNVEFDVSHRSDQLTVTPPFWRMDIAIAEDIVEEVGRLYGFDHLPIELPKRTVSPVARNTRLDFRNRIATLLAAAGANEVLTYSFVHGDLLMTANQNPVEAYKLNNAISPELQYYRLSLTPSVLKHVYPNIRANNLVFVLFEQGKAHNKKDKDPIDKDLPVEHEVIALVYAAADKLNKSGAAFYQVRYYLDYLAQRLGIDLEYRVLPDSFQSPLVGPYDRSRSALVYAQEKLIGIIGEFAGNTRQKLKLPVHSAGLELSLEALQAVAADKPAYKPLSKFPSVTQDMTLVVPASVNFSQLQSAVNEHLQLPEQVQGSLEVIDIFAKSDSDERHVTYRLNVSAQHKTLKDAEVHKLLDDVATKLSVLNIKRI